MFWTECGSNPAVRVGTMDGSASLPIATGEDIWPVSVAVDYESDIIYWLDTYCSCIQSFHIKGKNQREVFQSELYFKYGLSIIFKDRTLYWTMENQTEVYRVAVTAVSGRVRGEVSIAASASDSPSGFTVIDMSSPRQGGQSRVFLFYLSLLANSLLKTNPISIGLVRNLV